MDEQGNIWVALIFFALCFFIAVVLMVIHIFGIGAGLGVVIGSSGYLTWYYLEKWRRLK